MDPEWEVYVGRTGGLALVGSSGRGVRSCAFSREGAKPNRMSATMASVKKYATDTVQKNAEKAYQASYEIRGFGE